MLIILRLIRIGIVVGDVMNKKQIVTEIIALLNEFFKDTRAYSFTLFSWEIPLNKEFSNNLVTVNFKFHFEILNNKVLISGSQESLLFRNKSISPSYMNCDSTHGLATKIQKRIGYKTFKLNPQDCDLLSYFSGITFYKDDWKERVNHIFYNNELACFFASELHKKLTRKLITKLEKSLLITFKPKKI